MELVLGHHTLGVPGGSESYLLTMAEQLQRLGHGVTVFSAETGPMARVAGERGISVVTDEDELPRECDAVLVQDGAISLTLAERYPGRRQVFVAHGAGNDLQRPVQLEGVTSAVVVLNDRTARRLEALATQVELVRLRQPVDLRRFTPGRDLRREPERALLFNRYLNPGETEALQRACERSGLRLEHLGRPGHASVAPESEIEVTDIAIGAGRSALEAMACGRAVYVLERGGSDGWVTPDSYELLESTGFTGLGSATPVGEEHLLADLGAYRPEMGPLNRQLAIANHHAMDHAAELVALLRRVTPGPSLPPDQLREMSRLVSLQWETERRASRLSVENRRLHDELELERSRASEEIEAFRQTRRYRIAGVLAWPLDALRRALDRRG